MGCTFFLFSTFVLMLEKVTAWNDILPGLLWLVILAFYFHFLYQKKGGREKAPYFLANFYFKVTLAIVFGVSYALLYGGGDTFAYFQCTEKLNHLFFTSPSTYFSELLNTPTTVSYYKNFSPEIGYPPGWIYREPESYFIAKILSIISFFTFNSYWAITVVLAGISSVITYHFYNFVKNKKLVTNLKLAFALLFIPSVSFWCTGISKDTIVFLVLIIGVIYGIKIIENPKKELLKNILYLSLALILLLQIRTFLIVTLVVPLFMSLSAALSRKYATQAVVRNFLRFVIFLSGFLIIVVYTQFSELLGSLSADRILQEATITQQDFSQNATYGSDKYDIGITEYSFSGVLSVAPQSIFAGIYRPIPTEAIKLSLVLNGLESLILITLTVLFFYPAGFKQRIAFIRKQELLIFCLFFSLTLAFMTGFSACLFGVLVRLRAPLLPFFALFLVVGIWGKFKNHTLK